MHQAKTIQPRTAWLPDTRIKPSALPYAVTALAIGAVTLCQYLYLPAFAGYPFQFYFPVVAVSALLFGTGVFAAALSGFAALFVFIPPHFSLAITSSGPVLALITFSVGSLVIVLVVSLLSRVANHYFRALEQTEREKNRTTAIMLDMHRRAAAGFHDAAAALERQTPLEPGARAALQATARRFGAMGRLHEHLAMPRDPAVTVNARRFFERLCDDLQASLGGAHPARLILMIQSCEIAQRQATAAGHLLCELVEDANRCSTAGHPVSITVDLTCEDECCTLMLIEHPHGSGGMAALRPDRPVVAILLDQLQGSLEIPETVSPTCLIRFPRHPAAAVSA